MSSASNGVEVDRDTIDLTVPLDPAFAATVRVMVASIGADVEFSVDEIDDLRLGVSEVFNVLADRKSAGSARCVIRFWLDSGAVVISMSTDLADDVVELDALASSILSSVVDEFSIDDGAVTLRKRAFEAQPS